jgi:hypothetical protein
VAACAMRPRIHRCGWIRTTDSEWPASVSDQGHRSRQGLLWQVNRYGLPRPGGGERRVCVAQQTERAGCHNARRPVVSLIRAPDGALYLAGRAVRVGDPSTRLVCAVRLGKPGFSLIQAGRMLCVLSHTSS